MTARRQKVFMFDHAAFAMAGLLAGKVLEVGHPP